MAGSVVVTSADHGVFVYTVAWTSSAGGAVSSNAFPVPTGALIQVEFVPGASATQPTNLYSVTLLDAAGVDVLAGAGASRSNATGSVLVSSPPVALSAEQGPYDLVVANAGNAKTGTVTLWIQRLR